MCGDDGACADPSCPAGCAAGTFCREGACVDACEGAVCPRGAACRDGRCVGSDGGPEGPDGGVVPGFDGGLPDGATGDSGPVGRRGEPGCACAVGSEGPSPLGVGFTGLVIAALFRRRRR
ncbi:MAG: MYXO-CTERM sorting domain-containing protein [Myxococcales bacterium]|nr:MYXO-CTERM sorting domain-containing protein [Myxococcales bacterium]